MGQYYVPVIINEDGMKTFYSHDFDNGLKLMEHSWIGNNFVAAVLHSLVAKPGKLFWLGDYAEIKDFRVGSERLLARQREKAWKGKYNIKPEDCLDVWDLYGAYVFNFSRKEYIRLADRGEDSNGKWIVCPIPILTSVGNGKGGGDYYSSVGKEYIGIWAGDVISVGYELPDAYAITMTDKTTVYYFQE